MASHPFSVPDGDRDSARPEQASHPETSEADAAEPHALVPESGKHSNPSSGRSGDRDTAASLLSSMQTVQATSVGTSENDPEASDNDAAINAKPLLAPLELEHELHGDAPISTDALLAMPQGVEQNANHEDDDGNQHPLQLQREAASPPALQQNANFRRAAKRIMLTNKLANSVDSRIYRQIGVDAFHSDSMLLDTANDDDAIQSKPTLYSSQQARGFQQDPQFTSGVITTSGLKSILKNETSASRPKKRLRFSTPRDRTPLLWSMIVLWDPDDVFVSRWHKCLVLPLAYECWAGAFRLALGSPAQVWLQWLDITSDVLFLIDGIIFTNTALKSYQDPAGNSTGKEEAVLIKDRWRIVSYYFAYIFPKMILPSIVYLVVTFAVSWDHSLEGYSPNLWLWWMASVPRCVLRVRRLQIYFKTMDMNLDVSVTTLHLVKIALMIFMSAHWIGSIYFFVARTQPAESPKWIDQLPGLFPPFEEKDAFQSSRVFHDYAICLYKGVDGLVSAGYVPILPANIYEMILSMFVQCFAIWMTAYILGSIFNYLLVSQKDPLKEAHMQRMEDLKMFMDERRYPGATKKRLIAYFEFQYKKARQKKASRALKLPESLQVEVANALFRSTLEKCCKSSRDRDQGPFCGCSPQFLNAIVTKLRPVFLMPGEKFIRASEMILELWFVSSGYAEVMDGETVKGIIRSDVDAPSIVGEISFFLGVQQQYSVRAPMSSDIEMLMLSKEAVEDLFRDYPEQQEIINTNLLQKFNMDAKGNDIDQITMDDNDDPDAQAIRQVIKDTVKRRQDEEFFALIWAVTSGDIEELRRMLRKGAHAFDASNYDGKTVIHMAAACGDYRAVELLLTKGADRNKRDRWGNTALQEAINNNQGPVTQLLLEWKSDLNKNDAAGRLCDAASAGDLDALKLILEHGVDPNSGDYDDRTPLHLAAAEGHMKAVQYLISKGADVNFKDRWGSAALQDAVQGGHTQVVEHLIHHGAFLNEEMGADAMNSAAAEGDVRYLKLLIRCGVDVEACDYDSRSPLHIAAAEGRLLAVSYLLSVSANPNVTDRWGGTPMDDCVRGGTYRHLQCGKLLQCMGGKLGFFENTSQGQQTLDILNKIDMEDVRKVVKLLISQGLDSKKPQRATQQESILAFEATMALIPAVQEIASAFQTCTIQMKQEQIAYVQLLDLVTDSCITVAKFSDKVTARREQTSQHAKSRNSGGIENFSSNEDAAHEFCRVLKAGGDAEALISFFGAEDDPILLKLYEELDDISDQLERRKFESKSVRVALSKDFNRSLMNLYKVDEMWRLVNVAFEKCSLLHSPLKDTVGDAEAQGYGKAQTLDGQLIKTVFAFFDLQMTDDEARQVFLEAAGYSPGFSKGPDKLVVHGGNFGAKTKVQRQSTQMLANFISEESKKHKKASSFSERVSPEMLLVGSALFRNKVLHDENADVVQLLHNSSVLRDLSWHSMQLLCPYTMHVKLEENVGIELQERSIVAVLTGVCTIQYLDESEATHSAEVGPNGVVGEAWAFTNSAQICSVVANTASTIVILPWKAFGILFETKPRLVFALCVSWVDKILSNSNLKAQTEMKSIETKVLRNIVSNAKPAPKPDSNITDFRSYLKAARMAKTFDIVSHESKEDHALLAQESRQTRERLRIDALCRLVDCVRETCRVEWAHSPKRVVYVALLEWKASFQSKWGKHSDTTARQRRMTLRAGLEIIDSTWSVLSEEANKIHFSDLLSIKAHLGEVGVQFVDSAFPSDRMNEEIEFEDWMRCWIRYLKDGDDDISQNDEPHVSSREDFSSKNHDDAASTHDDNGSIMHSAIQIFKFLFSKLCSVYFVFGRKSITLLLLEDPEIAAAFKSTYIAMTGNIDVPLERSNVDEFLNLLLIDKKRTITELDVLDFMDIFAAEGRKGMSVTWNEIDRELKNDRSKPQDRLFVGAFGSALNPKCFAIRSWWSFQQAAALYYFVHVPVRIAFNPYPKMTSWNEIALWLDSFVDCLAFFNLLLAFNVSYVNKKSSLVSDRQKIARHYLASNFLIDLLCAIPFDWIVYLLGVSDSFSQVCRLPKMLMIWNAFKDSREGLMTAHQLGGPKVLVIKIWMLLHVGACAFFMLGESQPDIFTWYRHPNTDTVRRKGGGSVAPGQQNSDNPWPFVYTGFGGLNDPDDNPVYRTWKQYILCFYWVLSTITTTGVIGDMYPKNYNEILYTMVLLLISLTLFSYIIGQISAHVLAQDEELARAREEQSAVESYLNSFNFEEALKAKIKRHFQGSTTRASLGASEIFDSVSQSLRLEMSADVTRECLDTCMLFTGCSPHLKDSIKGLLREIRFGSGELLMEINTVANDMYFIINGQVEQSMFEADGSEVIERKVGPGGVIGVLAAYFGIRYIYTTRSATPCFCLRLTRNQLLPLLKVYPEDEETIADNAMREFKMVMHEKSVSGSRKGRSVRSLNSHPTRMMDMMDNMEEDEEEHSLVTASEGDDEAMDMNHTVEAVILSGIEQKLEILTRRRKSERISRFCSAATRGEIEKLERCIRVDVAIINDSDMNGRTGLHCAASEGQVGAVSFLLEARANVNVLDNYKNTPLNDAVRGKHDTVASLLKKFGARSLSRPGFEMGVCMCESAYEGDKDQIQRLLRSNVDINIADYDKRTALHLASSQGHLELVDFLLLRDADVNCTDRLGFSPLVDAVRHGHEEVQKLLRSKGGQLIGMDMGVELCAAAAKGNVPRMTALIENGANPNIGDYDSRTALHLAASNGKLKALDYLLVDMKDAVHVNLLDRLGGTPLDDAYRHGKQVAVAILESAGGKMHSDLNVQSEMSKMRADSEAMQRVERKDKVIEIVDNSAETKASVWIRGRFGKLLPAHLNELTLLSKTATTDITELTQSMEALWNPEEKSVSYMNVLARAFRASQTTRKFRDTAQSISALLCEELPVCRAALIFRKEYQTAVKSFLALLDSLSKSLQFLRFLLLKIPEVRQAVEAEEQKDAEHGMQLVALGMI